MSKYPDGLIEIPLTEKDSVKNLFTSKKIQLTQGLKSNLELKMKRSLEGVNKNIVITTDTLLIKKLDFVNKIEKEHVRNLTTTKSKVLNVLKYGGLLTLKKADKYATLGLGTLTYKVVNKVNKGDNEEAALDVIATFIDNI